MMHSFISIHTATRPTDTSAAQPLNPQRQQQNFLWECKVGYTVSRIMQVLHSNIHKSRIIVISFLLNYGFTTE